MIDAIVFCCSAQSDLGKASGYYYRVCIHCISLNNDTLHAAVAVSSQRMWLLVRGAMFPVKHSALTRGAKVDGKTAWLWSSGWYVLGKVNSWINLNQVLNCWASYLYDLDDTVKMKRSFLKKVKNKYIFSTVQSHFWKQILEDFAKHFVASSSNLNLRGNHLHKCDYTFRFRFCRAICTTEFTVF